MKLSNRVYDILMVIQLLALPISTFLTQLLDIWGMDIPYLREAILTFGALNTLLGAILQVSRVNYDGGDQNGSVDEYN